ncbi:MAG: TerD family protein [Microbacteriaceae bacterium]|nr:TerD family protein [Microbacteriaceae bacterium]
MAVSLNKGDKVNLNKDPGLKRVTVGLGWVTEADLDASAFMLGANGRVLSDSHFIFYNNKLSPDGSVEGADDVRADDIAAGVDDDEDQEQIGVDLSKVANSVGSIAFSATIDDVGVTFGDVKGAYIRIANADTDEELARYDLSGDFSRTNAVVMGSLTRVGSSWEFEAIGEGFNGGLADICRRFGVNV